MEIIPVKRVLETGDEHNIDATRPPGESQFQIADFDIVRDLYQVVPELIEELQVRRILTRKRN